PPWIRVRLSQGPNYNEVKGLLAGLRLHTVCQEACCPNMGECFESRTATFLIMGPVCTRNCRFCAVDAGHPLALDPDEPQHVAEAVRTLGLRYAVVTSVTRDDLPDGGASHFAETIRAIRREKPGCGIEVLIPDLQGSALALETILEAGPDVLNHNLETVPRLYALVRPQASYQRSLELLARANEHGRRLTKSGLMVGVGETWEELLEVMSDLRDAGCDLLTIGQYLRPSPDHLPIERYYTPGEFEGLAAAGQAMGFRHVEAGPLVRSSYHAHKQLETGGIS
ncbi:MAG: lipoyl synthase, partial [Dehalococcoidia bacterium]|nr:lipoyl synthase [Dehalococcoidia bacterium]